jgi:hypothetical protein
MCPGLTGCSANGLIYEEVLANMRRRIVDSLAEITAAGQQL